LTEATITTATTKDRARVIALWEETKLTRPWNDAGADFDRALGADNAIIMIATMGDDLVGSVMVGDDGHRGWVYYLGVAQSERKTGLGHRLMDEAETWLKARGCPKIQFMVREDNHQALGFYRALGYERQKVETLGRFLDQD